MLTAARTTPASRLVSLLVLLLPAAGCAKRSAEMPTAASAAEKGADKGAGKGESQGGRADDTTPPPGVDLSQLDDFERKVFFRVLNKESSACGKAHSLLTSVKTDKGCRKSLYAARHVARLIDKAYTDSEISESITKRFRGEKKTLDLGDAPVKGNPSAPVAVVEFVDYECPHCKTVQPVLRQLLEEYKDEVRVLFKHYPLGIHTNARAAAEAAMAAHKQGKFWVYNDKLWAIAEHLTPAAMEQIAKDVGLDVARWRADFESEAIKNRVQKDREEGERLAISSTPTIYINGRQFTDTKDVDSLKDWVNEELNR